MYLLSMRLPSIFCAIITYKRNVGVPPLNIYVFFQERTIIMCCGTSYISCTPLYSTRVACHFYLTKILFNLGIRRIMNYSEIRSFVKYPIIS